MDAIKVKVKALSRLKERLEAATIIVEGKRDVLALQRTGFSGNILAINSRRAEEFAAQLATEGAESVIVLTDFDSAGRKIGKRFTEALRAHGIRVDSESAKRMRWIFGIRTIEDLPSAVEKFEEKLNMR